MLAVFRVLLPLGPIVFAWIAGCVSDLFVEGGGGGVGGAPSDSRGTIDVICGTSKHAVKIAQDLSKVR